MREFGVDGDRNKFTSDFSKLFGLIVEGYDFGWAYEGEI
jgi:hypothetical protein